MRNLLLYGILLITFLQVKGETDTTQSDKHLVFFQPELLIGKTLHANSNFPRTHLQQVYSLSIGKMVHDQNKEWSVFYNYPSVGLTFSYSFFGNDMVGQAYSLLPFIILNTRNRYFNTFSIKTGLGIAYISQTYDKYENPQNLAIGSHLNWAFQLAAYYNVYVSRHLGLKLGFSYQHYSNGHTTMPNLGLNSFLISLSTEIYTASIDQSLGKPYKRRRLDKSTDYFISSYLGLGIHEFGGPDAKTGGIKRMILSFSFSTGMIIKKNLQISWGFIYRFYDQYYRYISDYHPSIYIDHPVRNASNIVTYFGAEFLMGHFGAEVDMGINLFKPFYYEHHKLYESDDKAVIYWLKKTIATRLGLKVYLFNTSKNLVNNFYLGVFVNANMGQADFSEVNVGFIRAIRFAREI